MEKQAGGYPSEARVRVKEQRVDGYTEINYPPKRSLRIM